MKYLHLFFLLVSINAFSADRFPQGEYEGTGTKTKGNGNLITYAVNIKAQGNNLLFEYRFPGIDPIHFELTLTFDKHGFFKVGTIGSGYCAASSCHYSVQLGEHGTEEWTYFFEGKNLHKVGSLVSAESKNYWEETLRQVR